MKNNMIVVYDCTLVRGDTTLEYYMSRVRSWETLKLHCTTFTVLHKQWLKSAT